MLELSQNFFFRLSASLIVERVHHLCLSFFKGYLQLVLISGHFFNESLLLFGRAQVRKIFFFVRSFDLFNVKELLIVNFIVLANTSVWLGFELF
jgi:hypothetical protein